MTSRMNHLGLTGGRTHYFSLVREAALLRAQAKVSAQSVENIGTS